MVVFLQWFGSIAHNGKRIGEVADKLDEKFNLAVT
ncbi:hypothetical protein SAMN05421747_1532 [Parapedobacter composti]|uniref:Uncharacterized protein n=1 Tax=Parapedobacter composti TaxID=623281 RepID=A0A1I1MP99_9SPHI|nr:hypothetical protein SAMN05421747_1532 [Parapedobacter composti]